MSNFVMAVIATAITIGITVVIVSIGDYLAGVDVTFDQIIAATAISALIEVNDIKGHLMDLEDKR